MQKEAAAIYKTVTTAKVKGEGKKKFRTIKYVSVEQKMFHQG